MRCATAQWLRLTCDGLTKGDLKEDNRTIVSDHNTEHEPPPIRQLSATALKTMLENGTAVELVDVRTEEERAIAMIDGSRLLDHAYHDALLLRDPNTPMVFQCHRGMRSQQAAEYFREKGFRNLYNLGGGIDAWSLLVDTSVPRY
jgi:monothiol glutaredoxin